MAVCQVTYLYLPHCYRGLGIYTTSDMALYLWEGPAPDGGVSG